MLTDATMIFVGVFRALGWHETNLWRNFVALGHSLSNCRLSALRKRFCVNIFRNESWNVTIIAWNMLLAHLVLMSTNPCCCVAAAISKYVFVGLILVGHVLEGSFVIESHRWRLFGPIWNRWLVRIKEIHDLSVNIASGHAELINFRWHMSSISWHVLLVEAHLAVSWAQ